MKCSEVVSTAIVFRFMRKTWQFLL